MQEAEFLCSYGSCQATMRRLVMFVIETIRRLCSAQCGGRETWDVGVQRVLMHDDVVLSLRFASSSPSPPLEDFPVGVRRKLETLDRRGTYLTRTESWTGVGRGVEARDECVVLDGADMGVLGGFNDPSDRGSMGACRYSSVITMPHSVARSNSAFRSKLRVASRTSEHFHLPTTSGLLVHQGSHKASQPALNF